MIKNHQTTIGIVEKGIQEANSTRIKLLGPEALLSEAFYRDLNLIEAQNIASNHVLDSYLFYILEKHTPAAIVSVEKGIGKLEKEGENYYINRLVPISQGKRPDVLKLGLKIADFEATRDTYLVIGTTAPSNINELLFLPHSMVSSNDKGVQTTPVPENSLVGRLDGDIEALNNIDLAQIIGNVLLNHIRLAPSQEPTEPSTGTIYFDNVSNKFLGYDGTQWKEF